MIGNDLIVAAPWIIFGAGLSAAWIRLLRARHASRRRPGRSLPPSPGPGGNFGYCEDCGSVIPAGLLAVIPETRYCPRCDTEPDPAPASQATGTRAT